MSFKEIGYAFRYLFNHIFSFKIWQMGIKNPARIYCFVKGILKHPKLFIITRKVHGLITPYIGSVLYDTVINTEHKSNTVVEVGAYKGLSTVYLAYASMNVNRRVKSFELFTGLPIINNMLDKDFYVGQFSSDKNIYENNLISCGVRNIVDLIIGDARQTLPLVIKDHGYSVAFLDVDVYEVMRDILMYLITVSHGGEVIIIHDIYLPGVRKAVDEMHLLTRNTVKETLIEGGTSAKLEISLQLYFH